jgi:hypothetical protein
MLIIYTQLQKVKKKKQYIFYKVGLQILVLHHNYAGVKDKLAMQEYQAPCSPTEIIQSFSVDLIIL